LFDKLGVILIGYLLFVGGEVPPNLTRSTARRPSAESYWVSNEGHPSPPHTINTICLKGAILTSSFFILKCQWCLKKSLGKVKVYVLVWYWTYWRGTARSEGKYPCIHQSLCTSILYDVLFVYVTCIYSSLRYIMVSSVDSTLFTMI